MYTVLIVDDEELICLGIKSMIERLGHPGISGVRVAANAAEAEEVMRSSGADIVISDIQMPGTNGLEMIKSLTRAACRSKFIVLSGYDDFKYAREALKLGVMDYLLKPASMPELKNVLDSAVAALDLDKRNSLEGQEVPYRQLLLENNLRKLFIHKTPDDFDVRNISDRISRFFPHETFMLGIFDFGNAPGPSSAGAAGVVANPGEGIAAVGDGWQAAGFLDDNGREVIVANHSPFLQDREVLSVFLGMAATAKGCRGSAPTVGLSGRGSGIDSLILLYRQAEKALSYRIIMGNTEVIDYGGIKDRRMDTALVDRKLGEFSELLPSRKEEQLSALIDSMFCMETLANLSIDCAARLYLGINRKLGSLAASGQHLPMEESVKPFESFATLQDIRIYLKERMHHILAALKEEDTGKKVMASVMKYMRDNMGEKISLEDAANRVGISYTHFSRLFKKRTGMNFSEYLMKVRMEEAKRLLDNSAFKVYEIAVKVGYSDPKHFCRAFRLYYNVSPIEYRSDAIADDK